MMIRNYQPIEDIVIDDGISGSGLGELQVLCAPRDAAPISILVGGMVGGSLTISQSRKLRGLLEKAEIDALLAAVGETSEEIH